MFMHLVAIEPAEQVAPDTEQQDTPNTVSQVSAPAPEPEEVTPTPAVQHQYQRVLKVMHTASG